MRASIVIASHNEGDLLRKTIQSCKETLDGLDAEIVVADDASRDGSVKEVRRLFPETRVVSSPTRRGVSPTKDMGARAARGKTLIFLDGHCRPQKNALRRLVEDVEELEGQAILTPRIPHVDSESWKFDMHAMGHGFVMDLQTFDCAWAGKEQLRRRGRFYESPALIGCCAAMSRRLYEKLWGFDREMLEWGLEDIDFGFKAWLLGHSLLLDTGATIGHRFRRSFENFSVAEESVLANKLRMARKNFCEQVWEDWLKIQRKRESRKVWEGAWRIFEKSRGSVERERKYLMACRVRNEFDFAERHFLDWPRPSAKVLGRPEQVRRAKAP